MEIIRSEKTKLKWKDIPKYKDDEYFYPIVQVQEKDNELHFKFTPFRGSLKRKITYMIIGNFRKYPALDIINALDDIGFNTRHSYDAVMQFYHKRGLDLGFTKKILKPISLWKT